MEHNVSDAKAISAGEYSERFIWCRPPSRQQLLDNLPYLGTRTARERWWNEVSGTEDERGRRLANDLNAFIRAANPFPKSIEDHLREDLEALDAEQKDVPTRIPEELRNFLDRMHTARRREREAAIREYVGLEDLSLIGLEPGAIAVSASTRAKRYCREFPQRDENGAPIHQETYHRKRRCEKWWRRELRKRQRRALLYVEAAVGAVGGPNVPGRPLYVSDYSFESYKKQLAATEKILEGLRLVCVDDPTIQIPMKELNARKKHADAAKRRLLMDAILARIEGLKMHLCWITITLPGEFVPHSTNEACRQTEWDPSLGPLEALNVIQDRHHETMCLLRERGIRPIGWWNAQAQQSGTPHRHLLLACPSLEDARGVCDAFRSKFASDETNSRQAGTSQSDPGCRAYVVGDADPIYAPPKGKSGQEETAASIAKYMARYASRQVASDLTTGKDDEFLRHAAWASNRRGRTHSWVGFDAGRSPSALWDTLWSKASRDGENADPENPRMRLAIRMMREVQECLDTIGLLRRQQAEGLEGEDREHSRDLIKAESSKAAHRAWHAGIAVGLWPDRDLAPDELEWLRNETAALDPEQERDAQPTGIPTLTPDGAYSTLPRLETALPPMPLRDVRESLYGERRAVTIGVSAPVARVVLTREEFRNVASLRHVAHLLDLNPVVDAGKRRERAALLKGLRQAGIQFSRRPDGTVVGFNLTGETILRTDREWIITDADTAEEMFEEWKERLSSNAPRLDHLSDNPTDPRVCPADISGSGLAGQQPPP